MIEREFRIRHVGDHHVVDRGTGDGWEPFDEDDIEDFYDVDPQFYQVLIGEHDYEVHMWAQGFLITAEFEEN